MTLQLARTGRRTARAVAVLIALGGFAAAADAGAGEAESLALETAANERAELLRRIEELEMRERDREAVTPESRRMWPPRTD